MAAALALTLATLLAMQVRLATAGQTVVIFNDFSDATDLQINGDAAVVDEGGVDVLRLTPATTSQAGSAFLTSAITLAADASFSTTFSFQILNSGTGGDGDGPGADGLCFVVQTVSNLAGGLGGGIGYAGIDNSVAVEFDTYNNGEPGGGNHLGIDLDGSVTSVASIAMTPRFNDGNIWYAWVDYNGASDVLEVRASQTNLRPLLANLTHTVDLTTVLGQTDAFVGFTSGTGSFYGDHDIRTWQFINAFNPVGLNDPPTANAGPDQTVTQTGTATSVTLDGSGSTDPDGDPLTYTWTGPFVGGTATGVSPTVVFATAGSHTVTLAVDDGNLGTDTDDVVITVGPAPATAAPPTAAPVTPAPVTPAPAASALSDTAAVPENGVATPASWAVVALFALLFLTSATAFALASHRRTRT